MNNAQPTIGIVDSKALVCKFDPIVGKVYCLEIDQPITRFTQLAQSFATAIVEREFTGGCDCATTVLRASKSADLPSLGLCVLKGTVSWTEATTVKPFTFTVTVWIAKGDFFSTADVCVDLLDARDVVCCVEQHPPRVAVVQQSISVSLSAGRTSIREVRRSQL